MKIRVNEHKCEILKTPVNEKELNVTVCEFEFADNITDDYVKEAYFTFKGTTYKKIIINNKCDIPPEALTEKGQVELGVVAYIVENGDELKRYNPSPVFFDTWTGSLKDEIENTEPITPTDLEQIQSQVAGKQDMLVSGTNIKTINHQSLLGEGNINIQGGSGGSSDYEDLDNKPSINDVELTGNKSLDDLGIQPQGDYALSSEIPSALSELADDSTHRLVTDEEKANWSENQVYVLQSSTFDLTDNSKNQDVARDIIETIENGNNNVSVVVIRTAAFNSLHLYNGKTTSGNNVTYNFTTGTNYGQMEVTDKKPYTGLGSMRQNLTITHNTQDDTITFSAASQYLGNTQVQVLAINKQYTETFVPTQAYHPTNKKYVDDAISAAVSGGESEYAIPTYCLKTTANFSSVDSVSGSNFPSEDLQKISDIINDAYTNNHFGFTLILSSEASQAPFSFAPFFPREVNDIKGKNTNISFLSNALVQSRYVKSDIRRFSSAQIAVAGSWNGDVFTATRLRLYNNVYDMLTLDNEKSFVPTSDYHPATKKYVDDAIASAIANLNN